MILYLKSKGIKSDLEKDLNNNKEEKEQNIFNDKIIELLSFTENNKKNIDSNKCYFIEVKKNSFKFNFYKYVLNIDLDLVSKINPSEEKNNINGNNNNSSRPKTIYKSVKFQKKYGVFEETKNKLMNEMNSINSKNEDIISSDINLPFYSNKNTFHHQHSDHYY